MFNLAKETDAKVVHAEADGAAREVRFYLKQTGRVRLEAEDDFE